MVLEMGPIAVPVVHATATTTTEDSPESLELAEEALQAPSTRPPTRETRLLSTLISSFKVGFWVFFLSKKSLFKKKKQEPFPTRFAAPSAK